jgi:hypothetical protein
MADKYYLRNTSTTGSYDVRIKGKLVIATIADAGATEITVDSGLATYRYLLPANAK